MTRKLVGNDCTLYVDNDSVAITQRMQMDLERDEEIILFRTLYNG